MKKTLLIVWSILALASCSEPINPTDPVKPQPEEPKPERPDTLSPQPDTIRPVVDLYDSLEVIDPGLKRPDKIIITPHFPYMEHEVCYNDFYNPSQDELDDYGNIDYVCAKGNGTANPIMSADSILLYQGTNAKNGGSYIRIRSFHGAKLLSVEVGTGTKTKLAYGLNGKAAKSAVTELKAQDHYTVVAPDSSCTEIKIYCMGTDKSERWLLNFIRVKYFGGFVDSDYEVPAEEYGPLIRIPLPYTETFEKGFTTMGEKPSYLKFGLTDDGRADMQWSTWYGCISWNNPIEGAQSPQLRLYQEDADYDQSQFGYLRSEFFVQGLYAVEFDYRFSDYFSSATISYCDFGTAEWKGTGKIKLSSYSLRDSICHYRYILDSLTAHNAKIRFDVDQDSAFPSSGHKDFIFDNITFCGAE